MGEHRRIRIPTNMEGKMAEKTPNGDGETKPPLSTHLVEVGDFDYNFPWGPGIESMYERIKTRAQEDDSLIVNVVQSVQALSQLDPKTNLFHPRLIVVLTAQRIGREDLERQQRLAQFGTGGPRR